jgi:hypothetical protein
MIGEDAKGSCCWIFDTGTAEEEGYLPYLSDFELCASSLYSPDLQTHLGLIFVRPRSGLAAYALMSSFGLSVQL